MKADQISAGAANLLTGDRARQHGDKRINHENIARGWQFWMETRPNPAAPISAWDVANMMEILKIARRCAGEHNVDDYVDGGNYSFIAGELAGD